ncbi:hypothetical protein LSH36_151g00049 [Paralvinella palmiformis]|uniref:RRM domain-containing protein n=1 Tax=Paralvinella palmiformis TaxID=53620 RepID=A0AAD9JVM8_9ANNE|nr:hypothetical protein LSH36_151g00049 [Paralvinella palmiformis]
MSAYEDGHATKRQRTDVSDFEQPEKRELYEDPHNPSPSQVVHVRGLPDTVTERDLIDALQSFGTISYIMVLTRKRQALVEFEDINGAVSLVKYSQNPIYVGHKQAHFNFSTSQKIQRPAPGEEKTNNVLLFTILNPRYGITVDVMHTICSTYGTVNRIVIFKKNGVQAMVEFDNVESAVQAKQSLSGADVYSGCCTLRVEYAKPSRLNVFHNNSESWDYTTPAPGVSWIADSMLGLCRTG